MPYTEPILIATVSGLAIAFTLLGLGRQGVVLDRAAGTITSWVGVCVPWLWDLPIRRRTTPRDTYRVVSLIEERRYQGSEGGGIDVFVVMLESWHESAADAPAAQRRSRIIIGSTLRYLPARRTAEKVAAFLDLGVVDGTVPADPVYRPPGTLDEPYSWRSDWTDQLLEPPLRPADARSSYRVDGDTGVIAIARRSSGVVATTGFTLFVATILALALTPGIPWAFPVGIGAFPGVLWFSFWVLPILVWDRVRVSPKGVEVRRISLLGWRRIRVPAECLEEIDTRPSLVFSLATIGAAARVISIRSDQRVVELAAGLDSAEQDWLLAVIRSHLLGLAGGG